MELTRRRFIATVAIVTSALLGGAWQAIGKVLPSRWLAFRPKSFPGKIRPLDEQAVRTHARWRG